MQTNLKRLRQVEHIRGHLSIQFFIIIHLHILTKKLNENKIKTTMSKQLQNSTEKNHRKREN
jgi:hypothetical protein